MANLEQELGDLLNGFNEEAESNTPDYILARYLLRCLEAYNCAVRERDRWYGVHLEPANSYFRTEVKP